jgi:hypothetical protein
VTARVSLWRVLRVRGKRFDTVVIDGNRVLNGTNNFFVGLLTFRGHEYRRGRYSYKDVDVVGNADICGNVMLTSGSSAEQRFR